MEAVPSLASQERATDVGDLCVRSIGSFVSFHPQPNDALRNIAAQSVQAFEPFRAPMTAHERAKRPRSLQISASTWPKTLKLSTFMATLTEYAGR